MRLPNPKLKDPPEIYAAIIQEHHDNPVRMAERLQSCGWTLADAAWAAVNWDLRTMAAAIANERTARESRPTSLSDGDLATLREKISGDQKATISPTPKKTTRVVRPTPEVTPRPPKKPTA